MALPLYQIDAFADRVFAGNPAAVCPLTNWLDDKTLQRIAAENNLSESAFFIPDGSILDGSGYHLRWFTPTVEVDLCGHATLASAYVVFRHLRPELKLVRFQTRSGIVTVTKETVAREGDRLVLDFPSRPGVPQADKTILAAALGIEPREVLKSRDYLCVYDTADQVRQLRPDMSKVSELGSLGVIVTAPGDAAAGNVDFVSRFFAPQAGIPEDPVTGSAHCTLTPYWSARLGRTHLHARQISQRGGELWLTQHGDRVLIAGRAAQYLQGTIEVE